MKKYIVFIGLQFFAYHAFAQTQQCDNNTTRTTTHGEVCGVLDNKVASYKGISYAKPPTAKNKLRFMPPQSADAWQGVFKATQFSPMCVQSSKLDLPMSEDCLYLNIWTPQNAKETSNKPVLFFIHGGAFVTGSGDDAIYNGEHLSRLGDAVVVTINYRLGALGFAYNKKHNIDGNMGLLDQQLALQWVNDNITAFGGDKNNITIFGESAGAMSVGFHLFSLPSSEPLFSKAIMESNPLGALYKNNAEANRDSELYLQALCPYKNTLKCRDSSWLQHDISTQELVRAQAETRTTIRKISNIVTNGITATLPWTPVVDPKGLITTQPLDGYAPGMNEKPFIIGVNSQEGVLFANLADKSITPATYQAALEVLYKHKQSDSIRNFTAQDGTQPYKAKNTKSIPPLTQAQSALSNLIGDGIFICESIKVAEHNKKQPVYAYYFSQPSYFNLYKDSIGSDVANACNGEYQHPCHGNELPYVFHTLPNNDSEQPRTEDITLSKQMAGHWLSFAQKSVPNSGWKQWQKNTSSVKVFNAHNAADIDLDEIAHCTTLWQNITPR